MAVSGGVCFRNAAPSVHTTPALAMPMTLKLWLARRQSRSSRSTYVARPNCRDMYMKSMPKPPVRSAKAVRALSVTPASVTSRAMSRAL